MQIIFYTIVSNNSQSKIKKVVGNPLQKNNNKSQIYVFGKNLNCREAPSLKGNILGYIDLGYYNIISTKNNDGYTWYEIEKNRWVANVTDSVSVYLKKEIITNNEKEKQEEALNKQENKQTEQIELETFTSPKNDYYYIYLKQGEKIYYEK